MRIPFLMIMAAAGTLLLAGCGGGNDASMPAPAPPAGGTTPAPPAPVDFNQFVVQLAQLRDPVSETKDPVSLDNPNFAFSDEGTAYATVLPAN